MNFDDSTGVLEDSASRTVESRRSITVLKNKANTSLKDKILPIIIIIVTLNLSCQISVVKKLLVCHVESAASAQNRHREQIFQVYINFTLAKLIYKTYSAAQIFELKLI